ncbi:MAG: hypothetical protein KAJ86_06925 [Alphaproteobacteria bacterium]|nr:hypothetical protein [Alphaproteobacteria bacterium]
MNKRIFIIGFGILFIAINICISALASERLVFNQTLSKRSQKLINNFVTYTPDIARIDVNEDGIDEFIVRPEDCMNLKSHCIYKILAESNNKIIELAEIQAKHLMIGNTTKHGIRNIFAFKNILNDFDYDVYIWEPKQSQYILSK